MIIMFISRGGELPIMDYRGVACIFREVRTVENVHRAGGMWVCHPQEIFISYGLENAISHDFQGTVS